MSFTEKNTDTQDRTRESIEDHTQLSNIPIPLDDNRSGSDTNSLSSSDSSIGHKTLNGTSSSTLNSEGINSDTDDLNSSAEGLLGDTKPKTLSFEHNAVVSGGDNKSVVPKKKGLTYVENLQNYHGETVDEKLISFITDSPVVMFSKSDCEFSKEATKIFTTLQACVYVVELDRMGGYGESILNAVKRISNLKTVPVIYINGTPIGGCTQLKALEASGELVRILRTGESDFLDHRQISDVVLFNDQDRPWEDLLMRPLFGFPDTLNNHVVRMKALLVFCIGVLGAVFWDSQAMHWVVAILLCDFLLTFLFGGTLSPLSSFSEIAVHRLPMQPVSGPPKQFAAFCGIIFTTTSTALFFGGSGGKTTNVIGATFCGLLAIAAGLESFLDFCLGCKFFGLLVRIGLIRKSVFKFHIHRNEETAQLWKSIHVKQEYPEAEKQTVSTASRETFRPDGIPLLTPAAYQYKVKEVDEWQHKFNVVRYVQIAYFMWPLALTSCAVAFFTTETTLPWIWQTIGVGAAGNFAMLLGLYVVRMVMYPRKVHKEWACSKRGPMFGLIFITVSLLSILLRHFTLTGGTIFAWIGVAAHLSMSIVIVARWIGRSHDWEHIDHTWLIVPVGNFITSAVLVSGDPEFFEFGLYLFGFALLMWLMLFAITLQKHITSANADERLRGNVFLWVASPAIASYAWTTISGTGMDLFSRVLFGFSIILLCCLLYTVFPMKVTLNGDTEKLSMSVHGVAFAINAVALTAISINTIDDTILSRWLAHVLLITGSWLTAVYSIQSIGSIIEKRLFRPEGKWGPFSAFNTLVHESIRGMSVKLMTLSEDPKACINPEFLQLLDLFERVHNVHAQQEDEFVFPTLHQYVPEHSVHAEDDHIQHREAFGLIGKIVRAGSQERADKAKGDSDAHFLLQTELRALVSDLKHHMDWEEQHLQPISRKYVPVQMQKTIVRQMWESVAASEWRVLVPVLIRYMPYHYQRVRWCRSLLWAMPERGEQIGLYLYHGLSDVYWAALLTDVPELAPRSRGWTQWWGWFRYY
ncbi:hypothetical protein SARC_08537 [Sphaeroforma arctica JP610]|uniref:Uncharacterized protein n=1 Tax=Sphaeroforma arctica JP610 TaxID=667725 RepID=A0A0L0FQJ1_9EUKA|nr:hypothetical protein SARC_08537 [Sphaeroforma arctica JP610]KNC79050.1 hypothetical protein SARC_08537 [Sphaeroforma arctica JP610]|eukprot:XP_014152952.1 hypothetical protein SARC_08537 [Sphaeroforma arctica JP610]